MVEACVVIATVHPSPTLTVHDTVSPCKGARGRGTMSKSHYSNHL